MANCLGELPWRTAFSVLPRPFHLVVQRLALLQTPDIVGDLPGSSFRPGKSGDMRRHDYFRMVPERVCRWQRFLPENIQYRTRKMSTIECCQQIVLDYMTAPGNIYDQCTRR